MSLTPIELDSSSELGRAISEMLNKEMGNVNTPLPEAIIARMREALDRHKGPCPYSVGEVITPRSDAAVPKSLHGKPAVVVEVLRTPQYSWGVSEPDSPDHGKRLTIRVLVHLQTASLDMIAPIWFDHADFELWEDRVAREAAKTDI